MRKVMHISDLHFGRVDETLVEALRESARKIDPHVIAVSGDLTQRARRAEFHAAHEFLNTLPAPKVVVPGNHDIPLHDVFKRFRRPLAHYREFFGQDIEPAYVDECIAVVGVNTARSLTFKGGRVNRIQAERVRNLLCSLPPERARILVTHHPFDLPHAARRRDLTYRSAMAMETLRHCAPDVLLAGHTHVHGIGTTARRYDLGGHSAIVVQAGTATSTRNRGEPNSFNLVHIHEAEIAVEQFRWMSDERAFRVVSLERFARRGVPKVHGSE